MPVFVRAGEHPRHHERPAGVFDAAGEVSAGQPLPGRRGGAELPRGRGRERRADGLSHGEGVVPAVVMIGS